MRIVLLIGIGSFIGGIARYLLSQLIQNKALVTFPYGTLAVNIVGCFLIGIVYGVAERSGLSNEWRLFIATGILGGFTTFSAFSYESINLMRDGQAGAALVYIAASIMLGLAATFIGLSVGALSNGQ
ncbi:MAG: fluoride efflux transporter CrcB [Daejeonella sp.]|uniref:fluoride efflux transporter CrcB n=1 Tax=Daejeonella sp. JGW-45 TaxID=3034148 RepID=UPI0023EE0BCA|nr:fluoride efflux transporter CrcB [Daejeonella sp. JGW-45]